MDKSYIHLFSTTAEFNTAYNGTGYTDPWVSYTLESSALTYNKDKANGHEYVDLGLPSGKLWATMNIGASTPEDYGNYYAWGELTGKSDYSWETYRFGESPFSKYDQDGLTTLELVDDVARAEWGGDWRMPTQADLNELTANTTNVWDSEKSGLTFTSKTNGNSIFIPAAGYCGGSSRYGVGTYCDLWSSSLDPSDHDHAITLYFDSGDIYMNDLCGRCSGHSVRGVLD